jgi:hypothetical protein
MCAGVRAHRPRQRDQNGRKAEDLYPSAMLMARASESGPEVLKARGLARAKLHRKRRVIAEFRAVRKPGAANRHAPSAGAKDAAREC